MNPVANLILPPLSLVYGAVMRARLAAYRNGLLKTKRLNAPVISVGNLTTGGTGKTPLVEWVCRVLAREGKKVTILTRGYGRANAAERVVASDGVSVLTSAEQTGDEPQLLAENLKGIASVICDSDRAAAGQWAIENLGADVLVIDDGYQHLQLTRDLNIAIIDATNPWGEGKQLPYGMMREPRSGLSRADCVVITRAGKESDPAILKGEINRFTAAPIFTSRMQTSLVRRIDAIQPTEVTAITQPLAAFCGVGNPSSFFNHLRREGFILAHTHAFPDHYKYQQVDLDNLCKAAETAGASSLITTAKDAVKLGEFSFELPCYVLEIEVVIDQQETLIDLIRGAISPRV